MPESVFLEEQKKEEERREEEQKRKKKDKQEERSPEMESKKGEIEKGADKGMAFGEAKVLTEVQFAKVHIKGTLASEKYEPVVKEELAVKLVEEEKKKEERKTEEIRKEEKSKEERIAKEEITKERAPVERVVGEKGAAKGKAAAIIPELRRIEIAREEAVRKEILQRERAQLTKLVEEARVKGMKEPTKEIASKLFQYYTKRGIKPTVALGRVILAMKRLGILKKKDTKGIADFIKSLFPK